MPPQRADRIQHRFHVRCSYDNASEVHLVPVWASSSAQWGCDGRLRSEVASLLIDSCKREYLEAKVTKDNLRDGVTVRVMGW